MGASQTATKNNEAGCYNDLDTFPNFTTVCFFLLENSFDKACFGASNIK
jgi:hypothetical protein